MCAFVLMCVCMCIYVCACAFIYVYVGACVHMCFESDETERQVIDGEIIKIWV